MQNMGYLAAFGNPRFAGWMPVAGVFPICGIVKSNAYLNACNVYLVNTKNSFAKLIFRGIISFVNPTTKELPDEQHDPLF